MRYLTLLFLAFLAAACGTDRAEQQAPTLRALDATAIMAGYTGGSLSSKAEAITGTVTTHYYPASQELAVFVTDQITGSGTLYGTTTLNSCNDCQIDWDNAQVFYFTDHLLLYNTENGELHRYSFSNKPLEVSAFDNLPTRIEASIQGLSRFPDAATPTAEMFRSAENFNDLLEKLW
ncbi:MAG: hypothetical protein WBA17_18655 [Saprospiraceae bacterium]